jgi:hypothetical protein
MKLSNLLLLELQDTTLNPAKDDDYKSGFLNKPYTYKIRKMDHENFNCLFAVPDSKGQLQNYRVVAQDDWLEFADGSNMFGWRVDFDYKVPANSGTQRNLTDQEIELYSKDYSAEKTKLGNPFTVLSAVIFCVNILYRRYPSDFILASAKKKDSRGRVRTYISLFRKLAPEHGLKNIFQYELPEDDHIYLIAIKDKDKFLEKAERRNYLNVKEL